MEKNTQTTAESVGQKTQTPVNAAEAALKDGIEKTENAGEKPAEGKKAKKTGTKENPGESTTEKPAAKEEVVKAQKVFIAPYKKAYPEEKAFHVTSDRQVFLEKDRGLAVLHQKSLKNGEKVQTIKVK